MIQTFLWLDDFIWVFNMKNQSSSFFLLSPFIYLLVLCVVNSVSEWLHCSRDRWLHKNHSVFILLNALTMWWMVSIIQCVVQTMWMHCDDWYRSCHWMHCDGWYRSVKVAPSCRTLTLASAQKSLMKVSALWPKDVLTSLAYVWISVARSVCMCVCVCACVCKPACMCSVYVRACMCVFVCLCMHAINWTPLH